MIIVTPLYHPLRVRGSGLEPGRIQTAQ